MPISSVVRVTSPADGDIITYPLAVIRGTTTTLDATDIYTSSTRYPIIDGHFTVQYHLQPGHNEILLSHEATLSDSAAISFSLFYEPRTSLYPTVRLVYLLASDSDGSFQSPDASTTPTTLAEGVRRFRTAGLMIQAATAEMQNAQGFSRRTFALAKDVHVHRLQTLTTAAAHKSSGMQLWHLIEKELASHGRRHDVIDIAVMSFTRFVDNSIRAHTALGGGPLALFGGASLFTWPASVCDIPTALLDTRYFDPTCFFDDSAGRAASLGRRACASTTIGALLHELGHCLSLPHPCAGASANGGGIMARGFDHLDRLFVQPQQEENLPFWDRGSAVRLRYHRFLQFEREECFTRPIPKPIEILSLSTIQQAHPTPSPTPSPEPSPAPHVEQSSVHSPSHYPESKSIEESKPWFEQGKDHTVQCHSYVGLGHVAYYRNGDNAAHVEFLNSNPHRFSIPSLADLCHKCEATNSDTISISAIDIDGNFAEEDYHKIQ